MRPWAMTYMKKMLTHTNDIMTSNYTFKIDTNQFQNKS